MVRCRASHSIRYDALCPCPNVRAIRRAHLIDVLCRASQPPTLSLPGHERSCLLPLTCLKTRLHWPDHTFKDYFKLLSAHTHISKRSGQPACSKVLCRASPPRRRRLLFPLVSAPSHSHWALGFTCFGSGQRACGAAGLSGRYRYTTLRCTRSLITSMHSRSCLPTRRPSCCRSLPLWPIS